MGSEGLRESGGRVTSPHIPDSQENGMALSRTGFQ